MIVEQSTSKVVYLSKSKFPRRVLNICAYEATPIKMIVV